jgi:tetratricopeptide (TPR) repeat protein
MNIPGAMAAYRHAEQVLASLPRSESLALLYIGLAQAAGHAEKTMEGDTASLKGMEIARGLGNEPLWLLAAAQQSDFLFSLGKIDESMKLSECAWQIADRMNDLTGAFETAWSGGYHPLGLWDPQDARRWFARELSRPRQAEAASQRAILTQQTAFANLMMGQLQVARELMAEAPRDVVEGLRQFYAGDWTAADRMLDEACDMMLAIGSRDGETVACFFRAQVHLAMGNLEQAESLNGRVVRNSIEAPIVPFELNSRAQAALIAIFRKDISQAREHIDRCRQIIAFGEDFRGLFGRVALAEAALADTDGDVERSCAMFAEAIRTFRWFGLVWEEAEAHFTCGNALLGMRDREHALEQFSLAQSLYEQHGAGKVWTERIESARRLAGSTQDDRQQSASSRLRASDEQVNVIRCEGDYFTLIYCGRVLRLKSSKGLNYVAQLLARPFASVAPEDLIRAQMNGRGRPRSSSASGAGPHSRERARIAVTKAIKSTIEKIRGADPALGRLLGVAIRTGYSCTYQPDPDNYACWNVEGMRLAADSNGHSHIAS